MAQFMAAILENALDYDGDVVSDAYSTTFYGLFDTLESATAEAQKRADLYNRWAKADNEAPTEEREECYSGGYSAVYTLWEDGEWRHYCQVAELLQSTRFK